MSSQVVRGRVEAPLREIEFTAALAELQGFLGRRVMVTVSVQERLGVSFVSHLERVESLPTEGSPVMLHFRSGEAVDLAPDMGAFLGSGRPGQLRWLEFWASPRSPEVVTEVILLSEEDE